MWPAAGFVEVFARQIVSPQAAEPCGVWGTLPLETTGASDAARQLYPSLTVIFNDLFPGQHNKLNTQNLGCWESWHLPAFVSGG